MKNCPKCNASLPDDAEFCFDCGENVAAVSTSVQPVQPSADEAAAPEVNAQTFEQQPQEYTQQDYTQQDTYTQQDYDYSQQNSAFEMEQAQPVIQHVQPTMDEVQPINTGYSQQGYYEQPQDYMQSAQPAGGYYGGTQQNYSQPVNNYYGQQGYQQDPAQNGYYSQPQQPVSQPFQNFGQQQMPDNGYNNPDYINPASSNMPGVTPGKTGGSSLIVPIILIILILAVIFIDVFWLFRDQIWGKDDSSTSAVSYITMSSDIQ